MKKVLSVLLALTMILAMMPTTFAADSDEPIGYTYVFSRDAYGSESDVAKADLATKTLSDIVAESLLHGDLQVKDIF